MTSGSLWKYYSDEMNDDANENDADNQRIDNSRTVTGKSFECKTKITGSTPNGNNTLNAEVADQLTLNWVVGR